MFGRLIGWAKRNFGPRKEFKVYLVQQVGPLERTLIIGSVLAVDEDDARAPANEMIVNYLWKTGAYEGGQPVRLNYLLEEVPNGRRPQKEGRPGPGQEERA